MYNAEEKVLTVTEEQFDEAIEAEMEYVMKLKGKGMGAMLFAMGGASFCHCVWKRLTGEKAHNDEPTDEENTEEENG